MKDFNCVQFLQWALPKLKMRWPGYRKVRRRVCKRIERRMHQLKLVDITGYRTYLKSHPTEWQVLDHLCSITISRFYRDKTVFLILEKQVLPKLSRQAIASSRNTLKIWSAGCASGEEAYTIALIWQLQLQQHFPDISLEIIATDQDPDMQRRINTACYPYSSIRYLPEHWQQQAFVQKDTLYCLKAEYRHPISFHVQDIRYTQPSALFDLLLCRNLVFTYFDSEQQQRVAKQLLKVTQPGGALVIGCHETLPSETQGFHVWFEAQHVYRKAITKNT